MASPSPERTEQSLSEAHKFTAWALYYLGLMLVKRVVKKSWNNQAKACLRAALKELDK